MKKINLILVVLFTVMASLSAANNLTVSAVTIPQAGTSTINIELNNDKAYTAFTLKLTLPNGISYTSFVKGNRFTESHSLSATVSGQNILFGCLSTSNERLSENSGTLLSVNITADPSLTVGTNLTAVLSNVTFSTISGEDELNDVNISITIGEPMDTRTVLDETSASVPEAATGVNVMVKRTIKANTWSTICLPFAMSESQVKTAFGDDVELGDFTGYEVEEDADENVVGLKVKFNSVDISGGMEANHPYIINVSSDITEFTADNVDISPEEVPTVAAVKRTKKQWSEMIGVYAANTTIDEQMLVLSDNKFYYSAGSTKMKAYRAYFDFYDVLTDVEEGKAATRAFISFGDDGTTKIENVDFLNSEDDKVYSLSGGYMGTKASLKSLPKGLYIVSGKKYIVK